MRRKPGSGPALGSSVAGGVNIGHGDCTSIVVSRLPLTATQTRALHPLRSLLFLRSQNRLDKAIREPAEALEAAGLRD
jgi:hypothetical protein